MSKKRVVIAIDYGTAASGYAWALGGDTAGDQGKIKNLGNVYLCAEYVPLGGKDLSIIATDSKGKLIPYSNVEPGRKRKKNYIGSDVLRLDIDQKERFFHKRVKMDLYDPESNKLESINVVGNSEPAAIYREINGVKFYTLDLIAETLRELSQRALEDIEIRTGAQYSPQETQWVITLPADASQLQKDSMREAARRAGMIDAIEVDNLIIAFEPEVAAIRIHCDDACRECFKKHSQDGKYITLIVDAGGGTVDITAYLCDFNNQNKLVEAGNSRASNAGSTYIDQAIVSYITAEFFPNIDWNKFQRQTGDAYVDLIREIARQKENFNPERDVELKIYVLSLVEYCEDHNISYNQDQIIRNRISIPKEQFEIFIETQFNKASASILDLVQKVKTNYPNVPVCYTIVGGLGCSSIYRQMVVERLKSENLQYVDLHDDNMRKQSVLIGAALYGDDPTMIDRRYCKYTFGTNRMYNFDSKRHQGRERFVDHKGNVYATNGFSPFIKKGDELKNGSYALLERWYVSSSRKHYSGERVETQIVLWEIQDPEVPEFLNDTERKKQVATYPLNLTCDSNGEANYVLGFTADKTEMRIRAIDCSNDELVLDEPVHFSSNVWRVGR